MPLSNWKLFERKFLWMFWFLSIFRFHLLGQPSLGGGRGIRGTRTPAHSPSSSACQAAKACALDSECCCGQSRRGWHEKKNRPDIYSALATIGIKCLLVGTPVSRSRLGAAFVASTPVPLTWPLFLFLPSVSLQIKIPLLSRSRRLVGGGGEAEAFAGNGGRGRRYGMLFLFWRRERSRDLHARRPPAARPPAASLGIAAGRGRFVVLLGFVSGKRPGAATRSDDNAVTCGAHRSGPDPSPTTTTTTSRLDLCPPPPPSLSQRRWFVRTDIGLRSHALLKVRFSNWEICCSSGRYIFTLYYTYF